MTVYAYPDPKSKKELKEWVENGKLVGFVAQGLGAMHGELKENGDVAVCGPHYPKAHKWYATVTFVDGKPVKVK